MNVAFFPFPPLIVFFTFFLALSGCGHVRRHPDAPKVKSLTQGEQVEQEGVVEESTPGQELGETVSAFDGPTEPQTTEASELEPTPANTSAAMPPPDTVIEQQIALLREIEKQIEQKQFTEALDQIKQLESSPVRQVVVRAKYLQGEALFHQEEFDLAMQVYEEIITKHAFSGLVLSALRRLIVCSEKLNLEEKRKKYHSILHDFFEEEV